MNHADTAVEIGMPGRVFLTPATAPILLWVLLASGQVRMRKVDGLETLDHSLDPVIRDEAT